MPWYPNSMSSHLLSCHHFPGRKEKENSQCGKKRKKDSRKESSYPITGVYSSINAIDLEAEEVVGLQS